MKKILRFIPLAALGAPILASAQSGINLNAITPYSNGIINAINYMLVPALMAIAFIVFLFGVYRYFIQGAADEKSRADGRQFTMWGVIGFVVILSLWGIVNLFMGTFGLSVGQAPPFPTIGGFFGGAQSTTGNPSPFGAPSGTTVGGTVYGPPSASQLASLVEKYQNQQNACSTDKTSLACKAAETIYSQSYYNVYPSQDPSAQYGLGGSCPSGFVPDDSVASGCAPDVNSSGPTTDLPDGSTCTSASACTSGICTNNTCTSSSGPTSVGVGEKCSPPTIECYTGLVCEPSGVCGQPPSGGIPSGGDCSSDPSGCAPGLSCIDEMGSLVCI